MFLSSEYELLDFGAGRKLERFGSVVLDRPAPAAAGQRIQSPQLWPVARARFELIDSSQPGTSRGKWMVCEPVPAEWNISHGKLQFELKLTDFGHVGVFPEQAANWDWIAAACDAAPHLATASPKGPGTLPEGEGDIALRVLNLFAYTGGSTLAAITAGAAVTHVDAARTVVAWARRNAELSRQSAAPVRWIVDDALKFTRRELRRKQRYNGVILDPPSYGHGPAGETWKLDEHLPELLSICRELTEPQPRFVLLTCHSPDYTPQKLSECFVAAGFARTAAEVDAGDIWLAASDGRKLHAGSFARWRKG
jgi:23S rRNA (cytosine1962-C5)-methyltransferase